MSIFFPLISVEYEGISFLTYTKFYISTISSESLLCLFFLKVFSENWVVYHYFNLRAHRYEMSVIEIYDQSRAVYILELEIPCMLFIPSLASYLSLLFLAGQQGCFEASTWKA